MYRPTKLSKEDHTNFTHAERTWGFDHKWNYYKHSIYKNMRHEWLIWLHIDFLCINFTKRIQSQACW